MSRAQREKGKRGEQEVAQLLRAVYPEVRTKRAGGESAAQDRGRDLLGAPGLCVQVKNQGRIDAIGALEEAKAAALENEIPIAFVRRTRGNGLSTSGWCAILPAHELVGLLAIARAKLIEASESARRKDAAGPLALEQLELEPPF